MSWVRCAWGRENEHGLYLGWGGLYGGISSEAAVGLARHACFLNIMPKPRPRNLCVLRYFCVFYVIFLLVSVLTGTGYGEREPREVRTYLGYIFLSVGCRRLID